MKKRKRKNLIRYSKVSKLHKIELTDTSSRKEIDKYTRNAGIAKFYADITKFEVDKLILVLESLNTSDLLMIVDSICTLIKENYTRANFVTNKIESLIKDLKIKELDTILILQGVREWFTTSELEEADFDVQQIFDFVYKRQVHYLSTYYLFGYRRADLQPFNDYLNSTWMGDFMRNNYETGIRDNHNLNSDDKKSQNQFYINENDKRDRIFPIIDVEKYDVNLIYKICNRRIFKCDRNTFDSFLVSGVGSIIKIKWLDTKWGCKAQLRAFVNEISSQLVKPKPINLMFNCEIDSDTTVGKLNNEILVLLKSCRI
ncbi:MAG: hypothetical protein WC542_00010 [Paludibacter sp.]|jgi:hypothetical protein